MNGMQKKEAAALTRPDVTSRCFPNFLHVLAGVADDTFALRVQQAYHLPFQRRVS